LRGRIRVCIGADVGSITRKISYEKPYITGRGLLKKKDTQFVSQLKQGVLDGRKKALVLGPECINFSATSRGGRRDEEITVIREASLGDSAYQV